MARDTFRKQANTIKRTNGTSCLNRMFNTSRTILDHICSGSRTVYTDLPSLHAQLLLQPSLAYKMMQLLMSAVNPSTCILIAVSFQKMMLSPTLQMDALLPHRGNLGVFDPVFKVSCLASLLCFMSSSAGELGRLFQFSRLLGC